MALSSTTSIQRSFMYDVFLSFRGEDVRKSFVDHLYKALNDNGIIIYKDDKKIVKGEEISNQLITAIRDSKFHIIVFSKNYASSAWCLEELAEIMECRETKQQIAYPIFYDVEPTEVRNQSGQVREAFAKHVAKKSARRWRYALNEASNLAGRELKNTGDGHEVQFIKKVVEDILQNPHFTNFRIDSNLVGMATRIEKLLSSLHVGSNDVQMIGIKGMGGAGKTTLARAVFDHISHRFEGKSFVENVRERSKGSGLQDLQQQVLSSVFNDQSIVVTSVSDGKILMKRMMPARKALVVLDDVDHIEQLEALVGDPTRLEPRSRIIITTRDEQVLVAYGIQMDKIYDASMLSDEEAIDLFTRYAFRRESLIQGYEDLSKRVVTYAAGLPLTIKTLGSSLCGIPKDKWEDTIDRLKRIPSHDTLKRLEISYDGLEEGQKQMFLHVACLLKGESEKNTIRVLETFGFHARIGLNVLVQKSLITLQSHQRFDYLKVVALHDRLEEMGENIVRRLHPHEPRRHMILWKKDEIEDILAKELGTEEITCIKLQHTQLHPTKIMQGFRKIMNLRFLYISDTSEDMIDEAGGYLPDTLRFLHWEGYPFWYLPKKFQGDYLVNLEMPWSNIHQLWERRHIKVLSKLKFIDLSGPYLKTFDLGMTPNLEKLVLQHCYRLVELNTDMECPHLKELNLRNCRVFKKLNISNKCPHLERLDLFGCWAFKDLQTHVEFPKLKSLNLGHSGLTNLNLGLTPNLEHLYLHDFIQLYMHIECPKLITLLLGGFKVRDFRPGLAPFLEKLKCLKALFLSFDDIECLPDSICTLKHLEYIQLDKCRLLKRLPEDIGRLECLKELNLVHCSSLQDIPSSIAKLKCLQRLGLFGCTKLKELADELEGMKMSRIAYRYKSYISENICELEGLEECIARERFESSIKAKRSPTSSATGLRAAAEDWFIIHLIRLFSGNGLLSYGDE